MLRFTTVAVGVVPEAPETPSTPTAPLNLTSASSARLSDGASEIATIARKGTFRMAASSSGEALAASTLHGSCQAAASRDARHRAVHSHRTAHVSDSACQQ